MASERPDLLHIAVESRTRETVCVVSRSVLRESHVITAAPAETLDLILPARASSVTQARHAVTQFAKRCDGDLENIGLGVSEAAANAVQHAYRDGATGSLHVSVSVNERHLNVEVSDEGDGMSPHPDAAGLGLGMSLIKTVTESVEFGTSDSGVTVSMLFPC